MGFFSGLADVAGLQAANITNNPEQAAVGANTPESTYALNKTAGSTMDKHYIPTVNMYGGATQGEMQQAQQQGGNMGPVVAANAVGQGIAGYLTMGASTMGQAALDQYQKTHPGSNFNQEYNGTVVAATPTINQGIYNNANQGVYAKGGTVGLHNTAHYLKSKGRNADTELVHMTKGEVQALKNLAQKHGGNLTTNPETGLPEAGFLSSVLPMVAGIGLDILTDGAMTPLLSGMLVGGADYAMTGSITKGLMAGLGAYGGADLTSSLADIGGAGSVTEESIANPANWGSEDTVGKAALTSEGSGAVQGLKQVGSSLGSVGSFLSDNAGSAMMAAAPVLSDAMTSNRPTIPTATATNTNPMGLKTLSPDFKGSFPTQPNPAYVAQYPDYKRQPYQPGVPNTLYPSTPGTYQGGYTPTVTAADGGLMQSGPATTNFMGGGQAFPMSQQDTAHYATPSQMPTSAQQTMASYEQNTNPLTGEPMGYAAGGIASYSGKYGSVVAMNEATQDLEDLYGPHKIIDTPTPSVGIFQDTDPNTRNLSPYEATLYRLKQKAAAAGLGKGTIALPEASTTYGKINPDATPEVQEAASGGIMGAPSLGGYASGGNPRLLKGPGDGMSDSIPANIGGKQPARLADGEFVVPADVVSHLGNGSTDAGAKKLYSMMDNIRKARTGRKKQAPAVKPEKYLPK